MNSFINTGSYDTDDFAYSVACLNRHSLEEQFNVRIKTGFLLLQYKEYKIKFNKETIRIIRVENPSFNFKKKMALVLDYAVFTEYVSFNFFSVYYIAHETNLN